MSLQYNGPLRLKSNDSTVALIDWKLKQPSHLGMLKQKWYEGEKEAYLPPHYIKAVWPDWAIYDTLGNFSKPVATIILPILPHF